MPTTKGPRKRNWITLKEAGDQIGVSRQRMHQLVEEYDVDTIAVNPRLTLISRKELAVIEKARKISASRA